LQEEYPNFKKEQIESLYDSSQNPFFVKDNKRTEEWEREMSYYKAELNLFKLSQS
jgi:hypothetical protein